MKNCISSVLTARIVVPCCEPTRVNHAVTAIRHKVRKNMSELTEKNRFNSLESIIIQNAGIEG